MIYLNLNLRNPWADRFKNVKYCYGRITEYKHWELQIIRTNNWFRFEFQYTIRQDHAGIGVELGLLGWELHTSIHDSRHWDYENKCWEVYGQSE
jgi:hypothetical protein